MFSDFKNKGIIYCKNMSFRTKCAPEREHRLIIFTIDRDILCSDSCLADKKK